MFVKKLTNLAADNTKAVPLDAVRRLGVYMRRIRQLKAAGFDTISSEQIVAPYRISPAQFRKDLSYFGKFGKSGVGYNVDVLGDGIRRVIGTDRVWPVALIGVGELGTALLRYPGFLDSNFKMAAAFEADPAKIGRVCNGVRISDIRDLKKIVAKNGIRVAMIAVNKEAAQNVVDQVAASGIKAILNFAPAGITFPDGIYFSNMDVACELEGLVCRLEHQLA